MPTTHSADRPSNGIAIAAVVCGLVGLIIFPLFIVGWVGLVLGIVALAKGQSKPMAIIGVVCGALCVLLLPVLAGLLIPAIHSIRSAAIEAHAGNALRRVFAAEELAVQQVRVDANHDGEGEYLDLDQLRSTDPTIAAEIDGAKRRGIEITVALPEDVETRQKKLLVFAWPAARSSMRHALCIGDDGQLRRRPGTATTGVAPLLTDALPRGWSGPPSWQPVAH